MWIAVKVFLAMLWSSPVVKAVVATTVADLTKTGAEVVQKAIPLISEAASMDVSGAKKFNYVTTSLAAELPAVGKAIVENCVQSAYRAYMEDKSLVDKV